MREKFWYFLSKKQNIPIFYGKKWTKMYIFWRKRGGIPLVLHSPNGAQSYAAEQVNEKKFSFFSKYATPHFSGCIWYLLATFCLIIVSSALTSFDQFKNTMLLISASGDTLRSLQCHKALIVWGHSHSVTSVMEAHLLKMFQVKKLKAYIILRTAWAQPAVNLGWGRAGKIRLY